MMILSLSPIDHIEYNSLEARSYKQQPRSNRSRWFKRETALSSVHQHVERDVHFDTSKFLA